MLNPVFNLHLNREVRDRVCRIIRIDLYSFIYISCFAFNIDSYADLSLLLRLQTAGTSHRCSAASRGGEFFNNKSLITGIAEFKDVFDPVMLPYTAEIVFHFIEMYDWGCMGKAWKTEQQAGC